MSIRSFIFLLTGTLVVVVSGNCAANEAESNGALPFVETLDVGNNRWRATGTVNTEDQTVRMAVIEDIDTGAAVLIRPGSWIFDGVRLENVSRDSVTVLVDGERVNLRVGSGAGRTDAIGLIDVSAIKIKQMSESRFAINYDNFRNMLGAASMYSSKDSVVRVRNTSNANMLQVKAVHPSGVLDRLGLESGDVIVAMQGEGIEGFFHAQDVLNEVRPGSTLLVVYSRAGAIRQLSIDVTP